VGKHISAVHYEREADNAERHARVLWKVLLSLKDVGPTEPRTADMSPKEDARRTQEGTRSDSG
jgi:hypothetical protein